MAGAETTKDIGAGYGGAGSTQVSFQTHPSQYKHIRIEVSGATAKLILDVDEHQPLRPGYELKLNSYDLGVDIELADAITRLRFEHPEVSVVEVTSGKEGVFSAGANIFMLGTSSHGFKVNFCRFTNETRLAMEDASQHSGQRYIAALNGIASGGGYELPLACEEIYLIDDRKSAAALPEIPYLGVLPGTGGLTRVVDKRGVRRDIADMFVTLAEGVRGKRAVEWGIVDGVFPSSKFKEEVALRVQKHAAGHPERKGIELEPVIPQVSGQVLRYQHVTLEIDAPCKRAAKLIVRAPVEAPTNVEQACARALRLWRELDDAVLRLRFHYPEVGLVLLYTEGHAAHQLAEDTLLYAAGADGGYWLARETQLLAKRVLKRLEGSARSTFAVVDQKGCFAGSLAELLWAADRAYALDANDVKVHLHPVNRGTYPGANGLTRLQTRFIGRPAALNDLRDGAYDSAAALDAGLITMTFDELDWDDELRLAIEERVSLSPDALTGMEQNIRFVGPETLETKIFGRLSAWQNWIFQRPNAVGDKGALKLYGRPESPEFDFTRT